MYYNANTCVVLFSPMCYTAVVVQGETTCMGAGCYSGHRGCSMEARTQTPTIEESNIVERVARIVSSGHEWRGTKLFFTRHAAHRDLHSFPTRRSSEQPPRHRQDQ